jgi:hypothetical protein
MAYLEVFYMGRIRCLHQVRGVTMSEVSLVTQQELQGCVTDTTDSWLTIVMWTSVE